MSTVTTTSKSLMKQIRDYRWAAEKAPDNPSRPNVAWLGFRDTTSSVIKVSKRIRSPALTASIQVVCTSRIARSSDPICNPHRQTRLITRQFGRRPSKCIGLDVAQVYFAGLSADDTEMSCSLCSLAQFISLNYLRKYHQILTCRNMVHKLKLYLDIYQDFSMH